MCYLSQGLAVGTTELTASFWDRLAFPSNFLLEHLTDWAYDERLIGSVTIHSQHKLKLNIRCLQVPNGNIRITNLNETFHSSLPRWMNSIRGSGSYSAHCKLNQLFTEHRTVNTKNELCCRRDITSINLRTSAVSVISPDLLYMQMHWEDVTLNFLFGAYVPRYMYI